MTQKLRVLVCDDSAVARAAVVRLVEVQALPEAWTATKRADIPRPSNSG